MFHFSDAVNDLRSSAIRDLMSVATHPDMISFAGGMPDNELFPLDEVREIYNHLSRGEQQAALQYAPTSGYPPLIEELEKWLSKKGLPVSTNRLIITTGSLQGINIFAKLFVNPHDVVLTENPSFIGALSAFNSYMADIRGIPLDAEGIDIESLKEALNLDPKMLYIMPTFHNPAGISYSEERRRQLLTVMNATSVPILEDDAYGDLVFDTAEGNHRHIPLKAMSDKEDQICYSGSFSKIFGPGVRLGWMLLSEELYRKAELCKQAMDACSPTFTQVLAYQFLATGKLESYVERVRKIYQQRCDYMVDAVLRHFPAESSFVRPQGGFYLWVKLPQGIDEHQLLKDSLAEGAVFVVGSTFDPLGNPNGYIRLSFSNTPEEKIEKGIRIIGDKLKALMKKSS
ncbi:MAG: PLP-dependent aminotransferase family protein [Microbacter sp.]